MTAPIEQPSSLDESATLSSLQMTWERLLARYQDLVAIDRRVADVLWPLHRYNTLAVHDFERPTMCLLAQPTQQVLYLGRAIVADIMRLLPGEYAPLGVTWFWLHQLVHVSQGLTYDTFRALNRAGDRQETMRADCHADFVSLKTFALFLAFEEARDVASASQTLPLRYHHHLRFLCDTLVPAMIAMEPNIFIPREREIEVRRIMALMILRRFVNAWSAPSDRPLIDSPVFPQWLSDRDELYVWLDQVNLLGRKPLAVEPVVLSAIIDFLFRGSFAEAYGQLEQIVWPPLDYPAST